MRRAVDPDSPTAREWLERELAKPEYDDRRSLLDRLQEWLADLLDPGAGSGLPSLVLWLLLVLVLVGAAVVLARVLRHDPARRGGDGEDVFGDAAARSAAAHRAAARAALDAGDHPLAVLEAFRALARSGVERTLLPTTPGLTGHEVVRGLGDAFPAARERLEQAGRAFDDVRYGDGSATREQAGSTLALDDELSRARPVLPELAGVPGPTGHTGPRTGGA